MKVRWRQHEMIGIAILVLWQIILLVMTANDRPIPELEEHYSTPFRAHGIPFSIWRNVLIPQLSAPLLVFAVYLLINLWVLPCFKKIKGEDIERLLSKRILLALFSLLCVSSLLAIGINAISFYARPHFFYYGGYQLLAITGYNDHPLANLFFGFGRALAAVALVTVLAGVRELIIWLIERKRVKRDYWIMVVNNATPLLIVFLCFVIVSNPLYQDFLKYLFFLLPMILLYLYMTFWLFPFMEGKAVLSRPVLLRILISTFICAIPGFLLLFNHRLIVPVLYWLSLVFVATQVFWIIYNQRKDRILQAIRMETALAKSDASLQFLKSQINPHFLFNALNTLYGTALKGDSDKTAEGIQKLGDMMRFMLHENTLDRIPMDKEIDYLKNYISLQKLRIVDSPLISIEDEIEERNCNHEIPPMLLIPFVENAFKHGISLKERSWVKIELQCREDVVQFEVRNSIHKDESDPEKEMSGIGLKNVTGRLELMYPNRHILDVQEADREFIVKLSLQC